MKRFKIYIFAGLFLIVLVPLFAVELKEYKERSFDTQKLEAYKEQAEFNYSQDYSRSDSFMSLILNYIHTKLANLFGSWGSSISPVIFKVIILIAIVVALTFILQLRYGKVLTNKTKSFQDLPVQFLEGEKLDYSKLLEESILNQQFKLATRYLFFASLHFLEQQKWIRITKWKAPYDYLNELPEEKKGDFKKIVDLFETTWYGDYAPNEEVVNQGIQFYRQLKNA